MKNQKGITLIALIITIIVMLILVGVSVSVALNTGLFKTAQGVAKNTQLASEDETALSDGTINIGGEKINIDDYINQLSLIPSSLKVGDIIEYTPASNYTSSAKYSVPSEYTGCTGEFYTDITNVEWKVIGIEGSTIKIIPKAVSTATLTISGANGWNNSIEALNSVCGAIYGNTTSEKYTATARSLTVEDINGITGYTVTPSTDSYPSSGYGESNYFPTAYLDEKGVKNYTEKTAGCGYAANSDITVEPTYYCYEAESETNFNTKFANWVNLGSDYWLASRCVMADSLYWFLPIRGVFSDGYVDSDTVFDYSEDAYDPDYAVRPVVSLTPTVSPTVEKTEGEGEDKISYWVFD